MIGMGLFTRKPTKDPNAPDRGEDLRPLWLASTTTGMLHQSLGFREPEPTMLGCGRQLSNLTLVAHYLDDREYKAVGFDDKAAWISERHPGYKLCKRCFWLI